MSDWKTLTTSAQTPSVPQLSEETVAVVPTPLLHLAEALQRSRLARTQHFDAALFGEPGWDMLLAVYIAHGRGYPLNVTDACFESRAPQTTALRWLQQIEQSGLVRRTKRVHDGRSAVVEITDQGVSQVCLYLEHLRGILCDYGSDTLIK